MSRLDSLIRRLSAQRDCLDWAAAQIAGLPGIVFELGLGQGRTYDHLRAILPDREIVVFERRPDPNALARPEGDHLVVGAITETLPAAAARFAGRVVLLHSDIGTGDAARNRVLSAAISGHLPRLLAPGAVVAGDQPLLFEGGEALPLPKGVPAERYYLYRYRPLGR